MKSLLFSLLLILIVGSGAALAYAVVWYRNRKRTPAVSAGVADPEVYRLAAAMVRLLDQGLTDPTLRVSDTWTNSADALVNQWYGGVGLPSENRKAIRP